MRNGVLPNIKGFSYLQEAVEIGKHKTEKVMEIYKIIALNHNDSAIRVERAIRHAISKIEDFTSLGINIRPTNSEFISLFL
jgi:hypothetical protein